MTDISQVPTEDLLKLLSDDDLKKIAGVQEGPKKSPFSLEAPAQYVVDTISNIPKSGADFVGNIAHAVMNPVETVKGLGLAAAGGVDAAARGLESLVTGGNTAQSQPGWERARQAAGAIGDFYSQRYGGSQNVADTIRTDPVGAAADASMLLKLGSVGLRTAGLSGAAERASAASSAINPMNAAITAAKNTIVPAVKNTYTSLVGQATGSGKYAVDQAVKGSKEFVKAMRGVTSDEQLVEQARGAVSTLKNARTKAYESALNGLKGSTNNLDATGIRRAFDGLMKRYGVKVTNGKLDFSRSTLSDYDAQNVVKSIHKDINSWGSRPGDLTAVGLDTLKRRIGNLYSDNNDARAIVAGMRENIGKTISGQVEGYSKMTSDYSKATATIREIEKALSIGKQSSVDTAATKLLTAIRKDNDFRRALMATLDADTQKNIIPAAAGRTMSNLWSNRLSSVATSGVVGGAAFASGHPVLASLVVLSSPRIAGELSRALGWMARTTGKGIKGAAPAAVPLEQAGKLTNK